MSSLFGGSGAVLGPGGGSLVRLNALRLLMVKYGFSIDCTVSADDKKTPKTVTANTNFPLFFTISLISRLQAQSANANQNIS